MSTTAVGRVLIIGYGNPLRSDDGFGWRAAQELSTRMQSPELEVMVRQQLTPDLAETASHFQLVIFIDAARDCPPGELRCEGIAREGNRSQLAAPSFSHSLSPASVLAWTADFYNHFPDAYYISVGGASFAEGESLSPLMQAAFLPLLARVQMLIEA